MFIADPTIADVLTHLDKQSFNLLLMAENTSFNIKNLIKEANDNGYRIGGGIFPMIVVKDNYLETGIIIKKLESASDCFLFKKDELVDLDKKLPTFNPQVNSCLLLLDGLMSNIPLYLESLYEKYWDNVSFFGAGCGSLSLKQSPCVFNNEGIFEDAMVMISIESKIQVGIKHGWEKIAGPLVVNKTDKNRIIEINWQPAFEVYKQLVESASGYKFDEQDFFSISKNYPFGIYREGEEDVVRDPISVDEHGVITCVGEINEHVSLNLLQGEKKKLINCAGEASQLAIQDINPIDVFLVDCISRVLYLGDSFKAELEAIIENLSKSNSELGLEGVLSLGEVSSVKGRYLEFFNKTIVVSAFYKT